MAVCRMCLASNLNLYSIVNTPLHGVYEKLTNVPLHADLRPIAICYICYAQLNKCYNMIITSIKANNVLTEILQRYMEISPKSVAMLDPMASTSMSTSYCISPLNHFCYPDMSETTAMECEEPNVSTRNDSDAYTTAESSDTDDSSEKQSYALGRKGAQKRQATKKAREKETLRNLKTQSGEKPYECNICNQRFKFVGNLKIHLRTHSGEKPYECNICLRKYSEKGSLNRHYKVHSGEKPYECSVCQRRFNHNSNLIIHLRKHTGEKPYECNVCQRRFNQISNLRTHYRKHTNENPYQCNMCPRRFSQNGNLIKHLRKHTGEKPYECNVCLRKFSEKGSLNRHSKIHTGQKPYECSVCQRKFNDNSNYIKHFRKHSAQ
ncbi:zinc finger protein 239-like isoform X1 [Plodia interpunctella]|uniref:zinc finger protein 239-like isoform X1 n=2 Tax=Plodia interpunctella TaxID=58824 RepID=UPI002368264A|nr:zinc finger protein 239-like isoform X1 [Plodia interpunctella]